MFVRAFAHLFAHSLSAAAVQAQELCWPKCSLGGGHADGDMKHRELLHLRVLALLGLILAGGDLSPQSLDFLHSRIELSCLVNDETLGTWGQSLIFAPINLATTP